MHRQLIRTLKQTRVEQVIRDFTSNGQEGSQISKLSGDCNYHVSPETMQGRRSWIGGFLGKFCWEV